MHSRILILFAALVAGVTSAESLDDFKARIEAAVAQPTEQARAVAVEALYYTAGTDELTRTPHQLMAFLYRADKWRFPPAGPPDGGTDYNFVRNPVFSEDGTLSVTVPGCTFYREAMLEGEYRLYVQLMMGQRRPPMPMAGDYFWGSNTEVFTLPFDGEAHRGTEHPLEVVLWPVVQ